VFIDGVAERLGRFFIEVDGELSSLSEKADNCVLQTHYFSNMRYLRCKREAAHENYLHKLTGFFNGFGAGSPCPI
jgi:hypothetical protein